MVPFATHLPVIHDSPMEGPQKSVPSANNSATTLAVNATLTIASPVPSVTTIGLGSEMVPEGAVASTWAVTDASTALFSAGFTSVKTVPFATHLPVVQEPLNMPPQKRLPPA